MSTSSDLTLLQSSLSTLLRPLPPSHSLPASLAQAQQTLLQRDLKLRLSAGGMRKCVQQLEGLREVEVRKRERKRTREAEGRVSVQRSEGWVQGMPKRWPGPEEGEREERYAALLARVKQLKRGKQRATQQLAHYSHLTSLLPSLSHTSIASHALSDPNCELRVALDVTAELLPGVTEELEADQRELGMMKREKKRLRRADADEERATTAGQALVGMLEKR